MSSLAQYARARAALAEATRIDEIVPLIEEVENVRRYAKQINDEELIADATVEQMRAERKLGFIITEAKKAGYFKIGRRKGGDAEENGSACTEPIKPTLEEVGVSKKLSSRAQKRSSIAEQAFEMMAQSVRERIAAANAVPINGARSVAPGRKEPSASLDFSPTPPWATRALIERVFPVMSISTASLKTAHEPACGAGHMAEVLRESFRHVIATDIHDYGYGDAQIDYLASDVEVEADWVITNPPFKEKAEQFALNAIERAKVGVAIFARLQWLETVGRYERLFKVHPPTQLAFFAERVNLCMGRWEPDGGTATAYMWLVWVKGRLPRAPFWIPPDCQKTLERDGDRERFTAHPVIKREHARTADGAPIQYDASTGEIVSEPTATAMTAPPGAQPPLSRESNLPDLPDFLNRNVPASASPAFAEAPAGGPIGNSAGREG